MEILTNQSIDSTEQFLSGKSFKVNHTPIFFNPSIDFYAASYISESIPSLYLTIRTFLLRISLSYSVELYLTILRKKSEL